MKKIKINLWNRAYNGGWLWFDKSQLKRFDFGAFKETEDWGCRYVDSTVWFCVFGICGRFIIQSWPWQKETGKGWPWNKNGCPKQVG